MLSMRESYELLKEYKIPHIAPIFISGSISGSSSSNSDLSKNGSKDSSKELSKELSKVVKYPVVLKVDSNDIIHKSEAGAVITNINDAKELEIAYQKIIMNVKNYGTIREIAAFSQEKGVEIYVGMKRDLAFGPVITFGLGGIFVEILKDVSLRVVPFSREECQRMILEIKGAKILNGARGHEPVNIPHIVDLIMATMKLSIKRGDIKELDFNPIFATKTNALVADVRIIT